MISRYIRSNVLGFVAIFIALGGVGVAAGLSRDSVRSKHIKNGQVKAVDVKSAQVQLRVGGSCPAGQAIQVVNVDGTVACEVDDVGGGGGAPSGPAGGALTGTYPNPGLAEDAVTSAIVAPDSLTAADIGDGLGGGEIDETAFQRRISTGCAAGNMIRSVSQDGSVNCEVDDDTIAPGGNAGGDLAGSTYPNPSLAAGAVEPDEVGATPAARAKSTGNPTLSNNSTTVVPLPTEEFDIGAIHDPASDTKLTAPIDGIYVISAQVAFGANATGIRSVQIQKNNVTGAVGSNQTAAAPSAVFASDVPVTTIAELNAGDFIELLAFQNSGGDLGIFSSRTYLSMTWLGPDP